jgi:hypothetical protein
MARTDYICAPSPKFRAVQRYTKSGCFNVLSLWNHLTLLPDEEDQVLL